MIILVKELDIRRGAMNKFLDKIRKIDKKIKEIDAYDRVYFHGKLFNLTIFILSMLMIGCFILAFVILGGVK